MFQLARSHLVKNRTQIALVSLNIILKHRHSYATLHKSRYFATSSFIQEVLTQVKKELKVNEELQQSLKEFQESQVTTNTKKAIHHISNSYNTSKAQLGSLYESIRQHYNKISKNVSEHPRISRYLNYIVITAIHIQKTLGCISDHLIQLFDTFSEDTKSNVHENLQRWKEQKKMQQQEDKNDISVETSDSDNTQNALILTKQTVWERFGTQIQDMPFLQHFLEYGIIDKFFTSETIQAAAIREMKNIDPQFKLPVFVDLVEYLICYHILHSFLVADEEALKLHCSDALFSTIQRSIHERRAARVELDSSILIVRNVEFKSACLVEDSTPWFIFTFSSQQINCMRDKSTGRVIAGSPDDIREIQYTMALRKHPEADSFDIQLEYPWQITEFAMIENTPSW